VLCLVQQKMEKELSWHKTALENAQRYLDGSEKSAGEQSNMDALRKDLAEKVCQLNPIFTRVSTNPLFRFVLL
jgi:hypothetical protein